MSNLINEVKRLQQLAGVITESQLEEALNKDIKAFGQDLEKRLKEAGFITMVAFHPQAITSQQQAEIKEDPKKVGLHVTLDPQYQSLQLRGNIKSAKALDKIVSRFQVANWNGPKMNFGSGWDAKTKQVMGGFNPGDIVGVKDPSTGIQGKPFYDANFTRYAITQSKVTTDQGGKTTKSTGVTQTMNKPAAQPQAESLDIDSIVNEALAKVRKKEQTNELFGFGAPTIKPGDEIKVVYDKPLVKMGNKDDGQYFIAKAIDDKGYFEISNYNFNESDFEATYQVKMDRGGEKSIDKMPNQIAKSDYGYRSNIWEGKKVYIATGDRSSNDRAIEKGKYLSIDSNGAGPKVIKLVLNGKEISKVKLKEA